jgi:hypothetical protein
MKQFSPNLIFISSQEEMPAQFRPLTDSPVVILVGLTGVGKSTIVASLQEKIGVTLLPDRRKITDQIIIMSLQQEDGYPLTPVTDRVKRFEYTARYRERYPGGMAHALSRLAIEPASAGLLLLFDGLRGLNEVQHAAAYFPQARFIVLDAPDTVRLARLLNRADAFDTTYLPASTEGQTMLAALVSIPDIAVVFNAAQLRQISHAAHEARLPVDEVVKKASIIVEERRNYDSNTARVYLSNTLPRKRVLIIDTATQPPEMMTKQILEWLDNE